MEQCTLWSKMCHFKLNKSTFWLKSLTLTCKILIFWCHSPCEARVPPSYIKKWYVKFGRNPMKMKKIWALGGVRALAPSLLVTIRDDNYYPLSHCRGKGVPNAWPHFLYRSFPRCRFQGLRGEGEGAWTLQMDAYRPDFGLLPICLLAHSYLTKICYLFICHSP